MSTYTDTALSPASVDQFIRKIVLMCDQHSVKWGTPQSLADFVRALDTNKHLAMDFWSIVARMSEDDSGVGPGPNRVLEVIVEGVTGRSIAEVIVTGRVERRAVTDLTRLLGGEDIAAPEKESLPISRKFEVNQGSKDRKARGDVRRIEELSGDRLSGGKLTGEKDVQAGNDAAGGEESPTEAALSSAPPSSSTSYVSFPAAPGHYDEPSPGWTREDPRRLVLEPEPLNAEEASIWHEPLVQPYERPVRIPLAEYEEMGKSRRAIVITLLLLLVVAGTAGGIFLVQRGYGVEYWQRFEAMIHRAWSGDAGRTNAGKGVDNPADASSPVEGAPASDANEGANQINEVAKAAAAAAASEVGGAPKTGAATTEGVNRSGYQQGEQAGSAARQRSEAMEVGAGANSLSVKGVDSVGSLVEVPAEAMQARLISSRVPVYPAAARADHIEGRVVMQAIVTKDGGVGHLHVASGDPSLRTAAMEAASAWRYRPYLVNGEPADVLTTISVDFLVDK